MKASKPGRDGAACAWPCWATAAKEGQSRGLGAARGVTAVPGTRHGPHTHSHTRLTPPPRAGEIDFMEHVNTEQNFYSTLHYGGTTTQSNKNCTGNGKGMASLANETAAWHTFSECSLPLCACACGRAPACSVAHA